MPSPFRMSFHPSVAKSREKSSRKTPSFGFFRKMRSMRRLTGFSLLVLSACASTSDAPGPELLAGVGIVDLTPGRAVPLGGYGARQGKPMDGVHDPVLAKALWLE